MAVSRGELKPSATVEEMNERLIDLKKVVNDLKISQPEIQPRKPFHGIIYEIIVPDDDDDEVEKDGGGFSKIKKPKVSFRVKRRPSQDSIVEIPTSAKPGKIETETGKLIEFYVGRDVLEATDTGAVLTEAVIDEPGQEAQFRLLSKSKGTDSYTMINLKKYCVCLSLKDKPELVSMTQDEIARHDNGLTVLQYITIFEDSTNSIALFFTHLTPQSKLFNYYLQPTHASSSDQTPPVGIIPRDVTHISDKDQIDIHREYLHFSNTPQNDDQTDSPPLHHRLFTSPTHSSCNGGSTASLELSDESRDSGCGQSSKDSRGSSVMDDK